MRSVTKARGWDDMVSYALVRLGHLANRRFAEKVADVGLRPRQVGALDLLRAGPMAQLDLAETLQVTPSVVVDMVDELEALGAVQRVRDSRDRRRQNVELTSRGRSLARRTLQLAAQLDTELLAGLSDDQARVLRAALVQISVQHRSHRGSARSPDAAAGR